MTAWDDPYRAFIGDITRGDHWPLFGYGVYVPPIPALVRHEGMTDSFGGSGLTLAALRRVLAVGEGLADGHLRAPISCGRWLFPSNATWEVSLWDISLSHTHHRALRGRSL